MEKTGLIAGLVLTIIGMVKIDMFLVPTLNYFGKYVFFAAFNIFVFWVEWVFYKKFKGYLKILMPLIWGAVILLLGVKFA
jgi:hypothetical protein